MVSPINWSRAARSWVNDDVLASSVGQRAALALEQLDDGVAHLVDLVSVETLEHRAKTTQQGIEVQRRLGVLLGDRRTDR